MKKIYNFNKFFIPAVIISSVIIIAGFVSMAVKGINFGIDFRPGMIEEVQIAPTAIELTYVGSATVSVDTSAQKVDLVVTGAGSDNETISFAYIDYATIGEMAAAMNAVNGVSAKAVAAASTPAADLFGSSAESAQLSSSVYRLHYAPADAEIVSIEKVRELFAGNTQYSVKQAGAVSDNTFQVRAGDDGSDTAASKTIQDTILAKFTAAFGEANVAVSKTDFVGSQFSESLALKSIILAIGTLALIWVYAAFRFHWDFALGAVIAVTHDALIMLAFMSLTQMEFVSISLAAILTIIGYSINASVVILDRVRENSRTIRAKNFVEIMNLSLTETLSRSIITTVTTLLAVIALYIFTTDSMKDFALSLIVGMITGAYSSIFILGAFVCACRKNWIPSEEEKKGQVLTTDDLVSEE